MKDYERFRGSHVSLEQAGSLFHPPKTWACLRIWSVPIMFPCPPPSNQELACNCASMFLPLQTLSRRMLGSRTVQTGAARATAIDDHSSPMYLKDTPRVPPCLGGSSAFGWAGESQHADASELRHLSACGHAGGGWPAFGPGCHAPGPKLLARPQLLRLALKHALLDVLLHDGVNA